MIKYKTDEYDIIRMAQSGNDDAMEYMLEKYKDMVKILSKNLFLKDGDKDDLLQEGMIGLFKAVMSYDEMSDTMFKTYACTCISRHMYSAVRKSNRKKNDPLNYYISIDDEEKDINFIQGTVMNPEDIMIIKEEKKQKEKNVSKNFSPMERKVFKYLLKGCDYREIAKKIDKPIKSVDNTIQRIKKKIKAANGT